MKVSRGINEGNSHYGIVFNISLKEKPVYRGFIYGHKSLSYTLEKGIKIKNYNTEKVSFVFS
nr:MAG TPA: hypothetical protein [Caudoviricetes sp.]